MAAGAAAGVTIAERAARYAAAYPHFPASHLTVVQEQGRNVLYGRWVLGNDYRNKTAYYGAYPPGYVERVTTLFPEYWTTLAPSTLLHLFSGSLPAGPYVRCDAVQPAEWPCSVYDLPARGAGPFWLVLADPPYSAEDAVKYAYPMVNRGRALRALAEVVTPGGFVCWLDTVWPMHRKDQWVTVGRIAITRSTNHRVRDLTIFERVGG